MLASTATLVACAAICSASPLSTTLIVPASSDLVQLVGRWRVNSEWQHRNDGMSDARDGAAIASTNVSWRDCDHPGTEVRVRVTGATQVAVDMTQQRPASTKYSSFQPNYFVVVVDGVIQPGFANATFSTANISNVTATRAS